MKSLPALLFILLFLSFSDACLAQAPEQFNTDELFLAKEKPKKDSWFKIIRMKHCPIKSCETKMVHTHDGKKFRGQKKFARVQNPKTGELVREPITDPKKHKKSPKVRKNHEYQKEFKLPEKNG